MRHDRYAKEKSKIVEIFERTNSCTKTAKELRIRRDVVCRFLKKIGHPIGPQKRLRPKTDLIFNSLEELKLTGDKITIKGLAKRTGLPYETVGRLLYRNGVKARTLYKSNKQQVAELIAQGKSKKEIMKELRMKRSVVNTALQLLGINSKSIKRGEE